MNSVLFVCEHGSAKSVVAAAHFNRLAAERGLPLRAISRGTDPDASLHPAAAAGLADERLVWQAVPSLLSDSDLATATRVVAFSELPGSFSPPGPVDVWTVPPVSEDYRTSRDAIVERVSRLLEDLAGRG
jgi:hypothetical protein